jgi:hypothetical protein
MYDYTKIINSLISERGYSKYLQIGIDNGVNLALVSATTKVGVDPSPQRTDFNDDTTIYVSESDSFFENWDKRQKFDLIFVDGLHTSEQVEKDILNSLKVIRKNGAILIHDIEPPNEWYARPHSQYKYGEGWCGDVWKSFWNLELHPFEIGTFEIEYGLGIIDTSKFRKFDPKVPKTFSELHKANKNIMYK